MHKLGFGVEPLSRSRRSWALLLWALVRVLVVLVSVQLTGLDAWGSAGSLCVGAADQACTDCPEERDGAPCPIDCPDCHCVHRVVALPGALVPMARTSRACWLRPFPAPKETTVAHSPALPSVYRPPRCPAASAVG